jgi:acetyltransferase-like isoleucine patch superfamily enzyme
MSSAIKELLMVEVKKNYSNSNLGLIQLLLRCKKNFAGLFRWLNAKIKLRRCSQVGRMVTVRGNLRVEGKGAILIGDRVKIWSHISVTQISVGDNATLIIGDNTFINTGVIISVRNQVVIGKNCEIAPQVIIMDSDFHGIENRDKPQKPAPVTIEDNVWLATRCTILKGVTIGKGAVVAAGAVVTNDVPPYTLVGGVPAKIIRHITPACHITTTENN